MCCPADEWVRAALFANLKDYEFLPHDIAVTRAGDVAAVSKSILRYSTALTD